MAIIRNVAEGLMILAKYDPESHDIAAEHDIIYAGPDPKRVTPEDAARLKELGWHIEEESWSRYV